MSVSLPTRVVDLRCGADAVEMLDQPLAELSRCTGIRELEDRCTLHGALGDRDRDAAAFGEQAHATAVAGHQRAFRGGEWHVEIAGGVLAVDSQRARKPDRHLCHADEVFDVAGDGCLGSIENEPV